MHACVPACVRANALSQIERLSSISKLKRQSVALQAAINRLFGENVDVDVDLEEPESEGGDNGDSASGSSQIVAFMQIVLLFLCVLLLIVAVALLIR